MSDYVKIQRLSHQWRSFFPDGNTLDLHEDLYDMENLNPSLTKKILNNTRNYLNILRIYMRSRRKVILIKD